MNLSKIVLTAVVLGGLAVPAAAQFNFLEVPDDMAAAPATETAITDEPTKAESAETAKTIEPAAEQAGDIADALFAPAVENEAATPAGEDLSVPLFEDGVIGDYIQDYEDAAKAKNSAGSFLDKQPQILEVKTATMPERRPVSEPEKLAPPVTAKEEVEAPTVAKEQPAEKEEKPQFKAFMPLGESAKTVEQPVAEAASESPKEEPQEKLIAAPEDKTETPAVTENDEERAPFDLRWGASIKDLSKAGWTLKPAERAGYTNVYTAKHAQHPQALFTTVSAIFGTQDKLWCIFAESKGLDDTPDAAQVLALYHKYYAALEQKYGNAVEHFQPYVPVVLPGKKEAEPPAPHPLGGADFLRELQQEKASLYATFSNDEIGVTLSVFVDEKGQSHLLLDYKNLPLRRQENDDKFTQVLEGL